MVPRVTMLTAIVSDANVYISLAQTNSNKRVFVMFLRYLVLKLDKKDPDWKKKSVIIMDGAAYHTADATFQFMRKLALPVMVFGPYSYSASICEL